ncbi:MAG: hypothetical protein NXI26_24005, partial [bacterium]|nr:hypothetical protein [bacterium]
TSLVTLGLSSFAPLSCKITALTLLINFPNISRAKGQLITLVATKSIDIKMVLQWHQKVMNIVLKADC